MSGKGLGIEDQEAEVKIKWFLFLWLVLLLSSLVVGCGSEAKTAPDLTPEQIHSLLKPEQVISRVQVYGIPHYYPGKPVNPTGQWAAVYEGEGKWRVRGSIMVRYEGQDYYSTTAWLHTPIGIELISAIPKLPQPYQPVLSNFRTFNFGEEDKED